jgi:tetratricopeptide (TPR) repeat protein
MSKILGTAILIALFLSCCAPGKKTETAAPQADASAEIASAEALYQKGCFVPLKQAFLIYEDLYSRPELKKRVAARLAVTALLLTLREKELGIVNQTYIDRAIAVIRQNPALNAYMPYAELAGVFWVQGKGVMRDIDQRFSGRGVEEKLKKPEADLLLRARGDEFFAYMYAVWKCAFSSPFEEKADLPAVWALFPDSLLLKYKRAICPREDENLLREIVAAEPQFYEAEYGLGNLAMSRGLLISAEEHYLKAHEGIPESAQITISLASISFATEELDKSLEFYDKTLAIAPEYRDALLGKAICLSYLGRPVEAIAACEKIIGLGYWLLGESNYWLAWNQHELKDNKAARLSIEEAKGRLPTSSEVFTLSGLIALEEGDLAKAEKDLKEALQYNPVNSDALLHLGNLYARKLDWQNSGVHFEKAAFALTEDESTLQKKMAEIEKSSMAPARKERLLKIKLSQAAKVRLTKATAFYNAAAGYYNAGQKFKALEMAARAAEHPTLKQKAEELMSGIK